MRILCFSIIFFIPVFAFSQSANDYKKTKQAIENCPRNIIQIPAPAFQPGRTKIPLPVSKIEVKDVREDTSYIGIQIRLYSAWDNRKCRKILFDKSLSSAFNDFLNTSPEYPVSVSPYSLLCFIKEFRITQRDSLNRKTKVLYNRLAVKAETFLVRGDNCYPAFKIDTVMLKLIEDSDEFDMIPDVLSGLLQRCSLINTDKAEAKHAYTEETLMDVYNKASDKPILQTSYPKAGIYMSFQEFINNRPSYTDYKLKADKLSASLYSVLPNGEEILQTKAFGYCDGTALWLNIANEYYPLIRRQSTFEYIGDYHAIGKRNRQLYTYSLDGSSATNLASSAIAAGLTSAATGYLNTISTLRGKVIHQLNLETGEIY